LILELLQNVTETENSMKTITENLIKNLIRYLIKNSVKNSIKYLIKNLMKNSMRYLIKNLIKKFNLLKSRALNSITDIRLFNKVAEKEK